MDLQIRKATVHDYSGVAALYQQVHDLHASERPDLFKQNALDVLAEERFRTVVGSASDSLFVAEQAGRIIGVVHTVLKSLKDRSWSAIDTRAQIESICVNQGHRGLGIGKLLLRAAEGYACEMGAPYIVLNVYRFNERAISIYETAGYEIVTQKMGKFLD